ncbi:hypothetical protein KJ966_17665 [bacterium]|nr:hypothetical protein [bacterium]
MAVAPDIDAANVLYKTLTTQSCAVCATVVLCGKNPVILTSRADSIQTKLTSISLTLSLFYEL